MASVLRSRSLPKKLVPIGSPSQILLPCSDRERKKTDQSRHQISSNARGHAIYVVTPHFSSARELIGTKLAETCFKKDLGISYLS